VVSLLGGDQARGRPRIVDEEKRNLILELYWNSSLAIRDIADSAGVSTMTAWRVVNSCEPGGEAV